jgi:CPA1 family monovalent cation:H+ antiporter
LESIKVQANLGGCSHSATLPVAGVVPHNEYAGGCQDCQEMIAKGIDTFWIHLRVCLSCGHVGCCDSSPNTHATKHHQAVGHPIVRSFEPEEDWEWCYNDHRMI